MVDDVGAAGIPVANLAAQVAFTRAGFRAGKSVFAPAIGRSVCNAVTQLARASGAKHARALPPLPKNGPNRVLAQVFSPIRTDFGAIFCLFAAVDFVCTSLELGPLEIEAVAAHHGIHLAPSRLHQSVRRGVLQVRTNLPPEKHPNRSLGESQFCR
jgi:hypothetical protein